MVDTDFGPKSYFSAWVSIRGQVTRRVVEGGHRGRQNTKDIQMRKLTAGFFHSVDGVVEAPDRWQFDAFDDELGGILMESMSKIDTVIMGRVGYQDWAGYWPNAEADQDFAKFINEMPKHVASQTLKQADLGWQNSTLIAGDVFDFVRTLKGQAGGEIAVMGGFSLAKQLFFAGLLEELTLITHPVVAGSGRKLFTADDPVTRLHLLKSQATSKGNVVVTYGLKPE
jgi:dihydrofolate reductase